MKYNRASMWMSRIVDKGRTYVDNPLLAGVLTIGWLPAALTLIAVDIQQATTMFLIGQFLACIAVVVAPFDIWYYDERLSPQFFEDIDNVITDGEKETLDELATRYDTYYARYWWVSTLPWLVLVTAVYVTGLDYFATQGITTLLERAAYFGFFLYWLLIAGLRTHSVIITNLAIRAFAKRVDLDIDPLHPDGLGGLSTVGNLAIRTTLIISSGSFALPLALQLAAHLRYEEVIYAGIGLFVVLTALNFIYPTYVVNRRAQAVREEMLEERRNRIRELENSIALPNQEDAEFQNHDLIQMEIQRARRDYEDYKNVTLYPLSIGIIIRLVSSVLLPIFFTLFDYLISRML